MESQMKQDLTKN